MTAMTRYGVIRYPTWYAVVDHRFYDDPLGGYRIVSRHRSSQAAWRKAGKLEKANG